MHGQDSNRNPHIKSYQIIEFEKHVENGSTVYVGKNAFLFLNSTIIAGIEFAIVRNNLGKEFHVQLDFVRLMPYDLPPFKPIEIDRSKTYRLLVTCIGMNVMDINIGGKTDNVDVRRDRSIICRCGASNSLTDELLQKVESTIKCHYCLKPLEVNTFIDSGSTTISLNKWDLLNKLQRFFDKNRQFAHFVSFPKLLHRLILHFNDPAMKLDNLVDMEIIEP